MGELDLVVTLIASLGGASVGSVATYLGVRHERKRKEARRSRPVIIDHWFWFEKDRTAIIQVKNIGKNTARGCHLKEDVLDKERVLSRREFWKADKKKDIDSEEDETIRWINYDSKKRIISFPAEDQTEVEHYRIEDLKFPIEGRISLFSADAEMEYYVYRIRLIDGNPYIQKAVNKGYAGPKYPEEVFDDKLENL
jgi:hypothetical protein